MQRAFQSPCFVNQYHHLHSSRQGFRCRAAGAAQTLRAQGVSGLYRGFGPALARSVPANGTCFVVYEVARTALGQMAAAPTSEACVPAFALAREL